MFAITVLFFVAFIIGMPVVFSDVGYDPGFEKLIETISGPFSVPDDMVFWTEQSDMDFWPEVGEQPIVLASITSALVKFWHNQDKTAFQQIISQDEDFISALWFWIGDLQSTNWVNA